MPVTPSKLGLSFSSGVPLAARKAREFLTTRYREPAALIFRRNSVTAGTDNPRKSTSTAWRDPSNSRWSSSTSCRFSVRFIGLAPPVSCRCRVLPLPRRSYMPLDGAEVDPHPGAHGRAEGDRPHVSALGRRRLGPDPGVE